MWEKALDLAINNGIWAVLFLCLLVYQLKDSKTREKKYQETIQQLNKSLCVVYDIKEDVGLIKSSIFEKRGELSA
ncbi:MAG: BhlA/UviB family holin-like peptide [Clostridia bacterium]|jgi:hypothetical protein|nr:BhlA/UviB family holin-like peptide [Clostridia bacterium]